LGKPSEIAAKYRNNSNEYLISPRYYTDYIKTLKIAIILIFALIVLSNVLQDLFTANSLDFAKIIEIFISETIEGLFEGAFTAFTIVTVVFFIVLTALDLAVGIHKMSTGIKTYSIVIFNGVKKCLNNHLY